MTMTTTFNDFLTNAIFVIRTTGAHDFDNGMTPDEYEDYIKRHQAASKGLAIKVSSLNLQAFRQKKTL